MSAIYQQMLAKHNGDEIKAQTECLLPLCDGDWEKAEAIVLKENKIKTKKSRVAKKSRPTPAPRPVKKEKYDMFDDLSIYVPAHAEKYFQVLTDIKIRGAIFKNDFLTASALVSVGRIHKDSKTKTSVDRDSTPFAVGKYVCEIRTISNKYDIEFEVVKRTKVQATFKYGDNETVRRKINTQDHAGDYANPFVLLPQKGKPFHEVNWKSCFIIQ
jgi:hypothetical protein